MYSVIDLVNAASLGGGVGYIIRSIQTVKMLQEAEKVTADAINLAKQGRDVVMEQRALIDKQSARIRALRLQLEETE